MKFLEALGVTKCAVCGRYRLTEHLISYITRRYDLDSDSHTDFELFYCHDNPSCADAVTELPKHLMEGGGP